MTRNSEHINISEAKLTEANINKSILKLFKKTGQDYFDSLVQFLCKETNTCFALVGEFNSSKNSVKANSFFANKTLIENFEYKLDNTPCAKVVNNEYCIYPKDVQRLFPKDEDLKNFEIESYAGVPLFDVNNNPVGIIVIMDKDPLDQIEDIKSILELITSKTELELERVFINKNQSLSTKDFIDTLQNFQDVFFWIQYNDKNEQTQCVISPSAEKIFGYSITELETLNFRDLYIDVNERNILLQLAKNEKQVKNHPVTLKKKDGSIIHTEMDIEFLTDNLSNNAAFALRGVCKDVTKRVKENLRIEIAYLIAEKSQRRLINLNLLGEYIHKTLNEIIQVSNFYIATIDYETKQTSFPYFKDTYSEINATEFSRPYNKNGFTEFVINNKQLLHFDRNEIQSLATANQLELHGAMAERLIGIPLKSDGQSVGALVIQSYDSNFYFSAEDIELLRFITSQIAVIIDRKKWQDKLIRNENYYRALVENSSEIICIININGIIEYISESCKRIIGFYPFELIGKNISDFIDIENPHSLLKDRIKNPKIDQLETLKIKTKKGNKKYLELSIANHVTNTHNQSIIVNAKDITNRVISDKKRAFAQKRLNTIHQIERALISDKSLKETLNDALHVISQNIYNVDRLSIGLIHKEEKKLEIVSLITKYKKGVEVKEGDYIPFESLSSIGTVLKKKSYHSKSLDNRKNVEGSDLNIKNEGIKSYFIKPLIFNNQVIGTLNMGSLSEDHFETVDESLIVEISSLLAVVINNAILKKNLATRKNDLMTMFNNTKEGIVKVGNKGELLVVNKSLCNMLGYSESELLTKSFLDITFEGDMELSKKTFDHILKNKVKEHSLNKRYLHKSGRTIDCKVSLCTIYLPDGSLDHIIAFLSDETERNQALKKVNDLQNALNYSANVLFVNVNGQITDVNKKLEILSGYSRKELIGSMPNIFNSSYHTKEEWKGLWESIQKGEKWQGEIRNKSKNGSIYWVFVTITPIFNNSGKIEQYIAIQFDITEEKTAKTNLIREVIEAQEQERERFAMEIHDGLGQVLLASKMNLNAISDSLTGIDDDSKKIFDKSVDLLNDAVQEARNISHGLMSRVLNKFGLSYALNEIVNNINNTLDLKLDYKHNIENVRFDEEMEMGIYRTLQELINNIIKHSKADKGSLCILQKDNTLHIQITDNGIGINQGTMNNPKGGGIGLRNMRSRIEYLGGRFIVDEKIKKGTKIDINILLRT